jgi:hypothetical protein
MSLRPIIFELTPLNWNLLEKLTFCQLVTKLFTFMGPECALASSHKSATEPYSALDEYSPYLNVSKDLLTSLCYHGGVYSGEHT